MTKCYFCYKNECPSYWDYYCESCVKIKQFCKLIGSEKLCKSLQFKINDEKLKKFTDAEMQTDPIEDDPNVGYAESDPAAVVKSAHQKPRKSPRLGHLNQ